MPSPTCRNGSLDVCDHFVYHAQHDVEGGDCQHINDEGVVRELEELFGIINN